MRSLVYDLALGRFAYLPPTRSGVGEAAFQCQGTPPPPLGGQWPPPERAGPVRTWKTGSGGQGGMAVRTAGPCYCGCSRSDLVDGFSTLRSPATRATQERVRTRRCIATKVRAGLSYRASRAHGSITVLLEVIRVCFSLPLNS